MGVNEAIFLRRLKNIMEFIALDVSSGQLINDSQYRELVMDVQQRVGEQRLKHIFSTLPGALGEFDQITVDVEAPGLDELNFASSFISNVSILRNYLRLNRKFTPGEKIFIGLCIAAILLSSAAFIIGLNIILGITLVTTGLILAGMSVAKGILSIAKYWHSSKLLSGQIDETKSNMEGLYQEIKLQFEVMEKNIDFPNSEITDPLIQQLDLYIVNGYLLRRLRQEYDHRHGILRSRLQIGLGVVGLIGAGLLFIVPPAGVILLALSGLISSGITLYSWYQKMKERQLISPERAQAIREGQPTQSDKEERYKQLLNGIKKQPFPLSEDIVKGNDSGLVTEPRDVGREEAITVKEPMIQPLVDEIDSSPSGGSSEKILDQPQEPIMASSPLSPKSAEKSFQEAAAQLPDDNPITFFSIKEKRGGDATADSVESVKPQNSQTLEKE